MTLDKENYDRDYHWFSNFDVSVLDWFSCNRSTIISSNLAVYQAAFCSVAWMLRVTLLHHNTVDSIGRKVLQVRV